MKDFDLIVHKLPKVLAYVNLYPIGDIHIGSENFDLDAWKRWKQMVMADENGYVIIVGDLLDNGLKNSLTNTYEAVLRPRDQKRWMANELEPIAHKILGGVQGNHEYRTSNLADGCPMYDIMAKLDIEHLYRPNMAFLKINLGEKNKTRQYSYTVVLAHGGSKTKTEKFSYAIDGMDVLVSGHIHQGHSSFPSKIVIDSKNNTVAMKGFIHVVVPSFQKMGGYALKAMYLPQDHDKIPVIRLSGEEKRMSVLWM